MSSVAGLLIAGPAHGRVAVLALVTACYAISSLTGHVDRTDFLSNLLPTVLLGLAMIGLRSQFQLTRELAEAREEVAQLAASEERLRLARDMHDLTGQSLSMITLKSELAAPAARPAAGRARPGPRAGRDRAGRRRSAGRRCTTSARRSAATGGRRWRWRSSPPAPPSSRPGIAAHDDADLTLLSGTFDPDAEAALAWCLREAVTNVVRHSGARNC